MKPLLTIGIATVNDYDGLYFTLQSIRLHHAKILPFTEFLIIDNGSEETTRVAIGELLREIPNARCLRTNRPTGTSARDLIFRCAQSEFVLVCDSHVLFAPDSLANFASSLLKPGILYHGILLDESLIPCATHWEPVWDDGMFGKWALMEPLPNAPTRIEFSGMGCFACHRDSWPGLNPRFRGFGGEEFYLHEKFRRAGGQIILLPQLRWLHRFERPRGIGYAVTWEDRLRNYWIGWNELRLDTQPLLDHFVSLLGREETERILREILKEKKDDSNRIY